MKSASLPTASEPMRESRSSIAAPARVTDFSAASRESPARMPRAGLRRKTRESVIQSSVWYATSTPAFSRMPPVS